MSLRSLNIAGKGVFFKIPKRKNNAIYAQQNSNPFTCDSPLAPIISNGKSGDWLALGTWCNELCKSLSLQLHSYLDLKIEMHRVIDSLLIYFIMSCGPNVNVKLAKEYVWITNYWFMYQCVILQIITFMGLIAFPPPPPVGTPGV